MPYASLDENSAVLDFLHGGCLDVRLDEAVLCYGRNADISNGLLKFLTLDWSRRPCADESLFYFSEGACDNRNAVVDFLRIMLVSG